jgi:anti-anti-sigma factor
VLIEPEGPAYADSATSVLRRHGTDPTAFLACGQLQVLAADRDLYSLQGQVDLVEDALRDGFPGVRVTARANVGDSLVDGQEHADLERSMNRLCHTLPVSALCQYEADLAPMMLHALCGMHADGIVEAQLRCRPTPDGLSLAGDVDVSNHEVLRFALRAATTTESTRDLVVDLTDLGFLDVCGARALLTGTAEHREAGGRLRLLHPSPAVERLLRLLELDRAPGTLLEPR